MKICIVVCFVLFTLSSSLLFLMAITHDKKNHVIYDIERTIGLFALLVMILSFCGCLGSLIWILLTFAHV